MTRLFFNASAACQYIADNNLPLTALRRGTNGMNKVMVPNLGGIVTAASSDACKGGYGRRCQS